MSTKLALLLCENFIAENGFYAPQDADAFMLILGYIKNDDLNLAITSLVELNNSAKNYYFTLITGLYIIFNIIFINDISSRILENNKYYLEFLKILQNPDLCDIIRDRSSKQDDIAIVSGVTKLVKRLITQDKETKHEEGFCANG